ncbi:Cytochrome P450 oxidoreductase [Lasiodiplodia theobromae]|uniref:Cytochrome P450 oxidoreductase n=1 Tax=Lasiodiplodia theobromae TaxID=45133 RepID=UPI0015C3D4C4|nr:Cytochrome P450 oxidoreductase [Lasiodiplodia theobromae]KAF4540642.1 Cytochrome P450 oxidoreductase [Lasiodiplodia theobromae]
MTSSWNSAALIFLAISLYKAVRLFRYIRRAKLTGIPYVVTPILETEILGFIATPILRHVYNRRLHEGQGWPRWCRFMIKDWAWEDKRRAHDEYGDVFLCVSPEGIICYSADAAMGWDVMNRRYDFTKPPDKYKPYGPNVATAEGANYRFHVRITAPPFGDGSGVNELVWDETVYQTQKLAEVWEAGAERDLYEDVNRLTLAVISRAGFGKTLDVTAKDGEGQTIPPGHQISFFRAIHNTTNYMVAILLLPGWLLNLTPLRKAHVAHRELDRYLREMIRHERARIEENADHQSATARGNLLTAVLRASWSDSKQNTGATAEKGRKKGFTDDEVMGNLFIYLLAGYETTANAIAYGLIVLALHQNIQTEVINEVDAVYARAQQAGRTKLTYSDDFEALEYTYGFMYETFRLFPGVTLITKMAGNPQPINISSSAAPNGSSMPRTTHLLPAETRVYLSAPAVHYNPRYWPDPYRLDPHRWTSSSSASSHNNKKRDYSVVAADRTRHMRGTLLTFSDGARACLGRKFAQAEYVAFFATLLRDYRVVLQPGQVAEEVERDLFATSAGKVTLAPLVKARIRLERRVMG